MKLYIEVVLNCRCCGICCVEYIIIYMFFSLKLIGNLNCSDFPDNTT